MRGQRSDQGTGQCPSSTLEGNGGEGSEHTPRAVTPRAPRAPAALRNGCTGRRHRGGVLGRARGLLRQRRPPGREPAHLATDAPGPVAFARWLPVLLGPGRGIRGHRDQHPHQRPPVRADPGFRRRPHGRPVPAVLAGPGAVRAARWHNPAARSATATSSSGPRSRPARTPPPSRRVSVAPGRT